MNPRPTGRTLAPRAATALVALALLGGLAVAPSPSAASTAPPACLPEHVSAVATLSSRPGGTTARVVLTSREVPSCRWAVPTGYQFLDPSGATLGPVVYPQRHLSAIHWVALPYGFSVVARVTTMSGVNCTTRSAARVRVTVPGRLAPLDVALPRSIGVCVGGTTAWTSVVESRVALARCATGQLALSLGPPNGAAGTSYYPLRLRNTARVVCALAGLPVVRALRAPTGPPVGPPARRLSLPDYAPTIALAPGATVATALGVGNVGNYPSASCAPTGARALSVELPGVRLVARVSLRVCAKVASLSVRGWVPGTTGQP